jgi:hypothetical protein
MVHRHNLAHEDHDMTTHWRWVGPAPERENTGRRGFAVYASTTPSVADGLILQVVTTGAVGFGRH